MTRRRDLTERQPRNVKILSHCRWNGRRRGILQLRSRRCRLLLTLQVIIAVVVVVIVVVVLPSIARSLPVLVLNAAVICIICYLAVAIFI